MKVALNTTESCSFKSAAQTENKLTPPGTKARDQLKDNAALIAMDGVFLTYGTASGAFANVIKNSKKNSLFDKFMLCLIPVAAVSAGISIYNAIKESIAEKKYYEAVKQQNTNK